MEHSPVEEELEKSCPRCGKSSKNSSNKAGRCSSCLKKLKANKKNPNRYEHHHKLADDALRRQDGKNGTASKKSSGRGSRDSLIRQSKAAYKKHGTKTTLSPDRKDNSKGYSADNTRMVPKNLNRGRHKVDSKKLANWRKKLKKTGLDSDEFATLLQAKLLDQGHEELAKMVPFLDLELIISSDDSSEV
jgi:hypothetical protein